MKAKVDVVINGKVITLKSEESAEYLHKVALYVDQKIEDLKAKNLSAVVDERVRGLLIAINIADDYFKIKDRHTAADVTTKRLMQETARLEKENASLGELVQKLQGDLTQVKTEFEEFLYNFDSPKEIQKVESGGAPKDIQKVEFHGMSKDIQKSEPGSDSKDIPKAEPPRAPKKTSKIKLNSKQREIPKLQNSNIKKDIEEIEEDALQKQASEKKPTSLPMLSAVKAAN